MERKIGEIFKYNGEWYQCVEHANCCGCGFVGQGECHKDIRKYIGVCRSDERDDSKSVIFKKLEKVGELNMIGNKLIQRYKIYPTTHCINVYGWYYQNLDVKSWTIDIEIKQNKEDMEEKKLNLKPFDIQKAREGKPVCTRDGRKARIICFDRNDNTPIVALIESVNHVEILQCYYNDGKVYHEVVSNYDLMMLPEKKEGWVNVYKDSIYDTKDEALIGRSESRGYIDTIKIYWEE